MTDARMDAPSQRVDIRMILVPLDLNRLSEWKIPVAEAQARAFGAVIQLLHVIPGSPPSTEYVTLAESQAMTYLNAIAARLRSDGIEARCLVRYGPVAEAILEEITNQHADLLVLGSNVRRGFSRLLLGSVAEELIARAPCPVLLVRPDVASAERTPLVRSFSDDVARAGPVAPRALGVRTIELARIVGSVGRASELDADFRVDNRSKTEQQRYERVRKAMEDGKTLPPIVLYKLGYGYYVLDGNHRVAAAKALGQVEIEAEVTEFVPLGDTRGQRVFAERRAFERSTGLTRIGVAQPGTYARLEAMIAEYAETHGIADQRDAARRWEGDVYRAVARRVRELRLGQDFADRRTADLFVEVADLREAESRREGRTVSWEETLERFPRHPADKEAADEG
jgi:nucleotide-binding universal stress UspA family protein